MDDSSSSILKNLLRIVPDTSIDFQDVVADEPDKIGKVWHCSFVNDESQHGVILHPVNIEGQGSNRDANHGFTMVEELDGFSVQREVIGMLKEKMHQYCCDPHSIRWA